MTNASPVKCLTILMLLTLGSRELKGEEYQANWDSLSHYQVPEWYQDAKFGIWPHWGVYSVPAYRGEHAAEWYGRWMHAVEKGPVRHPKPNHPEVTGNQFYDSRGLKTAEHHRETYGGVEEFGYHDFVDQWKAERFDPDEWADLAANSGAKFFCMMAQHHDSFSLYDSDHTEWDSVDKGPKRDLCREVKEAMAKRGLKFGVSNHMAFNSNFFAYYHNNGYADLPGNEAYEDLYSRGVADEAYVDRWWKRTTEAVDKLQPDLYYFDWGWHVGLFKSEGYHPKFAAYFYNAAIAQGKGTFGAPGVVMCSKDHDDPPNAVVRDIERGQMGSIQSNVWQTDTSISVHSWGYAADDEYFSTNELVDQLVDIVSKNGVLMLNFGPKADGTIPAEYKERLLGIGAWLKVCGEAIYATRPFSDFRDDGDRGDVKVRYTRSKDNSTLYAIALDWPGDTLDLVSLKQGVVDADEIQSVQLLGAEDELEWDLGPEALRVHLPEKPDYANAFPVRLIFKGTLP